MIVEARRIRRRAQLDRDVLERLRLVVVGVRGGKLRFAGQRDEPTAPRPDQVDEDRVAGSSRTIFDRTPARGLLPQSLDCLIDRADFEHGRLFAHGDAGVLAGIDRRQRLEIRDELQRLALLEDDVFDIGCRDGLEAALAQLVVHELRNEIVRDVVQDLILVTLPNDRRGHFARPEARHAGGARITLRDPCNFRFDDVGGDFEGEVLVRLVDFSELGLHPIIMC